MLRTVHWLPIVRLKLPRTASGLSVGLQSVPVNSDRFEIFEGEVSGWFGAVFPFRFSKLHQSLSGHVFRHCGHLDVGHQSVPVLLGLRVVGGGRRVERVIISSFMTLVTMNVIKPARRGR